MLSLFLFFPCNLFIQFFFHRQSCACGEANRRAEVFSGDFRLHAPPLFLGVFILVHQCPHGSQSGHGGDQRNRPRIAAAPYQPASAAVPRISTSMIHLRATSRLKSGSQSIHLEEYFSLRFPTRSSSLFISVSDFCISTSVFCTGVRSMYGFSSGRVFRISSSSQFIPSACSVSLFIACGRSHWITMGWIVCAVCCGAVDGVLFG